MNKSSGNFRRLFGAIAAGALVVSLPLAAPAASAEPVTQVKEVAGELKAGPDGRMQVVATAQAPNAEQQYLICLPGYHQLRNKASNLVADVRDVSIEGGAPLQVWENVGGTNQQFRVCAFVDKPSELIFIARHSGQCVDVAHFSKEELAPLQQWFCHYGENQRFVLEMTIDGGFVIGTVHTKGEKYLGFMLRHGRFNGLEISQVGYKQEVWLLDHVDHS